MVGHLLLHKRKYIGFVIIAILVLLGTYVVRSTEASVRPYSRAEMEDRYISKCPARIMQLREIIHFLHPCMRDFFIKIQMDDPKVEAQAETPLPVEMASSTGSVATSTNATSTEEGSPISEATSSTSGGIEDQGSAPAEIGSDTPTQTETN